MQNKPISIAIRETKTKIFEVLNNSGLPIDLMNYIVKDVSAIVTSQAENEYQQELMNYNSSKEMIDCNSEQQSN